MIGYATDFAGETASVEKLEECLKTIAEAGFTHIHWCHEWDGDYLYSRGEMEQIRGWMDKYGLKAKGVHATEGSRRSNKEGKYKYRWTDQNRRDYTSENEYNRQAGAELIGNRVELANVLGTNEIVLHMQLPYKSFEEDGAFRDRYYAQVFKSFDGLKDLCARNNVRICLENLLGTPNEHQRYQFDLLFDRYGSDFLGFCFDSGHANITGKDPLEFIRRYKDRAYSVHLSDNKGIAGESCWDDDTAMTKCDMHLNPLAGTFDWPGFCGILADSVYELPLVLEVSARERDRKEFMRESLDAGRKLTDMVKSRRLS
ncbi:MAG: sugar phosphate isomerase/epimerase [Treponemataceae bacterium]|jgi:sugar phosphate isomerase/epimerase|nr:MAG: sugar phosphate isomerase/epimerase [Treponemataceae bacterium]